MEIEIFCRESVKPSLPTPSHLQTYKLSLLDQLMPSAHVPIIFFYKPIDQPDIPARLEGLKQSLSKALTSFYPFAGKIKDDLYIDCNDDGVPYTEAKVSSSLSDILGCPDSEKILKFVPDDSYLLETCNAGAGIPVAMIQVNVFKCGGIAIGTKTSHKIIDGPTSTAFLKAWAATARRSGEVVLQPSFTAPSLFLQNCTLPKDTLLAVWPLLIKFGKSVMRRFVFDSSAVATLKARASSSSVQHPTRVEAVSAFIWQCTMTASEKRHGTKRSSVLSHSVNFRGKLPTQLPECSVGNLFWTSIAKHNGEEARELHVLLSLIRESILKIDSDFVQKLSGEDGFYKVCECLQELKEVYSNAGADYLTFSSLCKVGIYETDFGWGKPIWVSPGRMVGPVFQNLVVLNETRNGDGIEAWLILDEQDMAVLEHDTQILTLSSIDPSPLQL